MIIPVRCFTCGKVLADKWAAYERRCKEDDAKAKDVDDGVVADSEKKNGKTSKGVILDELGITQTCCRTVMLTHVDMSLII